MSATCLALFGDFVDALGLTRSAFEAVFYAEYFREHPTDALTWDRIGTTNDLYDVRDQLRIFENNKKVRETIRSKYGGHKDSHDRFFVELSTYGTHINPKTVGLRLSTKEPNTDNLGFVSQGKLEAPILCASHILHTVGYTVSEFRDSFSAYLSLNPDLVASLDRFEIDLAAHRAVTGGRHLSLLR